MERNYIEAASSSNTKTEQMRHDCVQSIDIRNTHIEHRKIHFDVWFHGSLSGVYMCALKLQWSRRTSKIKKIEERKKYIKLQVVLKIHEKWRKIKLLTSIEQQQSHHHRTNEWYVEKLHTLYVCLFGLNYTKMKSNCA